MVKKLETDRKQQSFMLVIEPKKQSTGSCLTAKHAQEGCHRIGYSLHQSTKTELRNKLIKELREFGY